MLPKQDRVHSRKPSDLEHKYRFEALDELESKVSKIADYIVEQGVIENWTYRKWASGSCEMWRVYMNTAVADGIAVVKLPFPIQASSMFGYAVPGDYYSETSLSNHYGISQKDTQNINIYVRDSYTANKKGTVAYCNIYIKAICE